MRVEANYKDLNSLGDYLVSEADDFNKKINNMINKLEELETYWSGPDYDNYREVYKTYLLNTKTTYIELNAFGNALKTVSGLYSGVDNDFGNEMRRFGNEKWQKVS